MVGVPKTLNSRYDYIYLKENFPEDIWMPAWKAMWESRKHWMPTGVVENKEDGIEDETHRLVEQSGDMLGGDGKVTWQQEEYVDDPYSPFFWYGFTEEEVKEALGIK